MRSLNLASRPFRNERLPKVLLGLASVLVAALFVWHVRRVYQLLPAQTSGLAAEVRSLEDESRRLRDQATGMRARKASTADTARWALLKELVDRRVFSWTRLLSVLEESMPEGVRLETVTPRVEKGQFMLAIRAVGRDIDEAFTLMRTLEGRPEFEDVVPVDRHDGAEGVVFQLVMKYQPMEPSPPPSPMPSAAPSPGQEDAPAPAPSESPAAEANQ